MLLINDYPLVHFPFVKLVKSIILDPYRIDRIMDETRYNAIMDGILGKTAFIEKYKNFARYVSPFVGGRHIRPKVPTIRIHEPNIFPHIRWVDSPCDNGYTVVVPITSMFATNSFLAEHPQECFRILNIEPGKFAIYDGDTQDDFVNCTGLTSISILFNLYPDSEKENYPDYEPV